MTKAFIVKLEIGTDISQSVAEALTEDLHDAGYDVIEVKPWAEHNPALTGANELLPPQQI